MPKWVLSVAGAALAVLLVAGGATAGMRWWSGRHTTALQQALAMAPADSQRFSFTDWSGLRRELGVDDLTTDSTSGPVSAFLDRGFDRDLTSTSAIAGSAVVLQRQFGFSPATVDWELFSQSASGAAIMLHLPDSTDFSDLSDRLAGLGYDRPDTETGIWDGGEDLIARLGAADELTPEMQYVALDADRHLVLASDTDDYLRTAIARVAGDGATASSEDGIDQVAGSDEPLSAAIYTGDYACGALAMGQAEESDSEQANDLIARAGKVNPYNAFAMAMLPGKHARVSMAFDDHDQAVTNADSRSALASGPAPGQGGDFADRFDLGRVSADGSVVTMDLTPVNGSYLMTDLSTGPVLYATC